MSRLSAPHTPELDDEKAELVRIEHERKIVELQACPLAGAVLIRDVLLRNGIATPIPHGLGRPAQWVRESCVRGGVTVGFVEELRDASVADRKVYVTLRANNYGGDVTADVMVL